MIYDCITFFNELDLLEIRLNILKDVVDKFVIVESDRTFTNRPKPLYFDENKGRFAAFADRIIHVVVRDFPPFKSTWHYESYQRNAILRGLTGARPDDIVLFGDADEIPNPEMVRKHLHDDGITVFDLDYFAYYLNFHNVRQQWCYCTRMLSYQSLRHVFDGIKTIENEMLPSELNEGTTPSKVRMRMPPRSRCKTRIMRHGGWHFTSLGGAAQLAEKIRSFSHQEYNPGESKIDLAAIEQMIRDGKGPFWEMRCFGVPLDASFPQYILDNREKYAHLIFNATPEYMRTHRVDRFIQTLRGKAIGFAERACPAAFHNWLHLVKLKLTGR